jgi:peptide/nickel transport system permease protein
MSVTDHTRETLPSRLRSELASWSLPARIGASVLLFIALVGLFAPWIAPYDPYYQDFDATLQPPGAEHWLGTDSLGRDILSRILHGIRIDLQMAFVMTYASMALGVVTGVFAAYRGGIVETVMLRLIEVAMAFPYLVLIILLLAILGPGVQNIYIATILVSWTMYARLVRGEVLVERNKDYVVAAKVLGYGGGRIVFRHILPNVIGSSVVYSMADFVLNLLFISSLSFLGLGVRAPLPEWGSMIADGKDFILQAWWISTFPGLAIVITGGALSLFGDGLARRLGHKQ